MTKRAKAAEAMELVTKVACNKEGDDNSNEGNGNKGGRQELAMRVMVTMWAMATAMRLAGDKENKGKGIKGDDNGKEEDGGQVDCDSDTEGNGDKDEESGQATATTTTMKKRKMAIATVVVGNEEGNGNGSKSVGDDDEGGG